MCGIGGIIKLSTGARSPLPAELGFMTDVLRHRGPDGVGQWIDPDGIVGLCHRRLAIVDLTEHGAQPMVGAAGPVITYNGEVYNHVELRNQLVHQWPFASRSDTEVILAAYQRWGTGCVDHLRGMYAFAIWDPARKVLFAARDNLGIKPFYYSVVDDRLIFASEIKAILPFLPETKVCKDGIAEYLTYQFNVGAQTMFEGVHALPPGHVLTVDEGRIKTYAHWDVQYRIDTDHSKSYFYSKLQDIVDRSVRIHLRSDVPVGCYLSGGVDSSLISLLSTQHDSSNKHSFHGKFTQFPGYDESGYAQAVAEQSSKSLHQIDITEDDVLGSLEDITYYLDQPTAGPGSIPQYLVSKLAAQHVKVVLGGQGGDEIFGGYARYLVAYFEQTLKAAIDGTNRQGTFVVTAESIIPNLTSLKEYKPMLASFWQGGLFGAPDSRYFRLIDRFSDMSGEIMPEHVNREAIFERFQGIFNNHANVQSRSYLDRMTHFDLKTLLPALLHVEDRMSMAHGIESRVPFVDPELVSFMATVPANIKFRDGGLKIMLKEAYAGLLPQAILERKDKMGFPVPLAEWYNGKLGTYVRDIFSSRAARERSLYDTKRVVAALGHSGKFSRKTWGLLSLELWHQRFIDRAAEMRAALASALDGQPAQAVAAPAEFRGRRKAG